MQQNDRESDKAYAGLRQMIIRIELEPGSAIDEQATMKLLGVGRTPLREAIHRLAAERLVVVMPRRGRYLRRA
jgi:DNA-binding GntR family transcriptional regulator